MNLAPSASLGAQIAAFSNRFGPETQLSIQYQYETDANGELRINGARVQAQGKAQPGDLRARTPAPPLAAKPDTTPNPGAAPADREAMPDPTAAFRPEGSRDLGLSSEDFASLFGLDSNINNVVSRLAQTDIGVRGHEAQHLLAAGGLATGPADYDYVEGPDGKLYAVGGQVGISSTATSDPAKQRRDASAAYLAATAPADSSAQDLAAARSALSRAAEAYGNTRKLLQEEPESSPLTLQPSADTHKND